MTTDHQIAQTVCTPAELEAWTLAHRGMSTRNIALALNLSRTTAKDRVRNAQRKIADARKDNAA